MLNHGSPQIPRGPTFSGASLEVGDATRAQAYLDALQEDVGDVKLVPLGRWWTAGAGAKDQSHSESFGFVWKYGIFPIIAI